MTLICSKIDVTTKNTPLVLFTAQWMFACENDWDDPTCQMVEQLQKLCAHISVISCLTVSGFGPVVAHTCCFLLAVSPWLMMLAQGESGFFSLTPGPHDMGRMSDVLWPSSFGSFLAPRTPVTEPKVPKLVGGAQMCLLSGVFVGVLVF